MYLLLVIPFLSKNTNDTETFNFLYELAFDKYRHSTFTLKNDSWSRSIYYFWNIITLIKSGIASYATWNKWVKYHSPGECSPEWAVGNSVCHILTTCTEVIIKVFDCVGCCWKKAKCALCIWICLFNANEITVCVICYVIHCTHYLCSLWLRAYS